MADDTSPQSFGTPVELKSRSASRSANDAQLFSIQSRLPSLAATLPKGLVKLSAPSANFEEVLAALYRDGAVILLNAVSEEVVQQCKHELAPYLSAQNADLKTRDDTHGGSLTKRVGCIVGRSPASHAMVQHPLVLRICHAVLGKQLLNLSEEELNQTFTRGAAPSNQSWGVQCGVHQAIFIEPGNTPQPFHEDLPWVWNWDAKVEVDVSTMWALDDFTKENGCTRVVPTSHRWTKQQLKDDPELYQSADTLAEYAEMPKGSVVVFCGHTVHSGGANKSSAVRGGLNVDYCLDWLRQETCQYLDVPPSIAKTLPESMQRLIGYTRANPALGYYDAYKDPEQSFHENGPLNWATQHLFQKNNAKKADPGEETSRGIGAANLSTGIAVATAMGVAFVVGFNVGRLGLLRA